VTPVRRIVLALFALVLAVASIGGLSACGSGGGNDDVNTLLKETFGPNKPVKSGDLALGLNLDLKGIQNLNGPIALKLKGPFASQGPGKLPRFDFTATLGAAGQNFSAGAVSTGGKGFVKFQGKSYVLTPALYKQFRQGYEQAQKSSKGKTKGDTSLQSLGVDPSRWLKDAKKTGEEKVGGADTVHIEAGIDTPKFLEDVSKLLKRAKGLGVAGTQSKNVPNELTPGQRDRIVKAVKSARMDLWTGKDDKTLRRIRLLVDLNVPKDQQRSARGLQSGKISFDLTIARLNEDQTVNEPKGARPLSELTGQFSQLLGGGAAGAGTTPPAATPPPPGAGAGSGASKEYLQCLQKAGQDVSAVQACADLLRPSG
jgi:hypothetical protein